MSEPTLHDVLRCLEGAPGVGNEAKVGPFDSMDSAAAWLRDYLAKQPHDVSNTSPVMATKATSTTLVGYFYKKQEPPYPEGNCFSVLAGDESYYRIVNFHHANLKALLNQGLTWPIPILDLGRKVAIIHDARIGHRWYRERWCDTCCPAEWLPWPQRLEKLRDAARGARVESSGKGGISFVRYPIPGPEFEFP